MSTFFLLSFSFFFFFFFQMRCKSFILFCPSSQDYEGFILWWKGGKGVDICFSRLKWSTLKNQTQINKYQQTDTTDQLFVRALSRYQRWLIDTLETELETEKELCGDELTTVQVNLLLDCGWGVFLYWTLSTMYALAVFLVCQRGAGRQERQQYFTF